MRDVSFEPIAVVKQAEHLGEVANKVGGEPLVRRCGVRGDTCPERSCAVDQLYGNTVFFDLVAAPDPPLHLTQQCGQFVGRVVVSTLEGPDPVLDFRSEQKQSRKPGMQPGDAERLVDSGLDQLNASLDGATQETYAAYRRGGSLVTALANLERLVDAKRRAGAKYPIIEWQCIVSRQNYGEIDEVRRLAREIGVDILRFDLPFSLVHIDEADDQTAAMRWLADDPHYRLWAGSASPNGYAFPCACSYLWTALQVNVNGKVTLCPNRMGSQRVVSGRVAADGPSARDLWNAPVLMEARCLFDRHPRQMPDRGHPCAACREFRQPWKERLRGSSASA